jgi:hypothetical protein
VSSKGYLLQILSCKKQGKEEEEIIPIILRKKGEAKGMWEKEGRR